LLYVFDVLHLAGKDLTGLPLLERKQALVKVAGKRGVIRRVDHVEGDPVRRGLRRRMGGALRQTGRRAVPVRSLRRLAQAECSASQEAVIGGWTEPRGARSHFGALLIGYYDTDGLLRYAGKVGTGFGAGPTSTAA
jgi:bifunctional non-homologous end joining protein LigD